MLPQYFEVKNDSLVFLDNHIFSIDGYKNIFRVHAKKIFYKFLHQVLLFGRKITISNQMPIRYALKQLKNNALYDGFFHSESYFEDFKDEIRKLYNINEVHTAAFEQVKKQLMVSKRKAVIHVRRGDYVDSDLSLPLSYYKKVIDIIGDTNVQYIFISDDPSYIEKEFDYMVNKYISTNSEIIDLQFLINADICVLSNSSFSWWGAWLNNNKSKQIFAPEFWLGFKEGKEYPTGIADHMDVNWIPV